MRKTVYTVVVDDYFPELCAVTLPNIEAYAKRIGADFKLITERKHPDFPPTYEKVQVYELGKGNDLNILIDADMLIAPSFWDVSEVVPENHVGMYMAYDATPFFPEDDYFRRYGKRHGVASNFLVVNKILHDFWTPLDEPATAVLPRIKREFIVDEYCFSRNLARFGLQHSGVVRPQRQEILHLDVTTTGGSKETLLRQAKEFLEECEVKGWAWENTV